MWEVFASGLLLHLQFKADDICCCNIQNAHREQ